jgi:hypothetical protein
VSGRHDGPTGPSGWCRPIRLGRPVPYPAMPSSSSGYGGGHAEPQTEGVTARERVPADPTAAAREGEGDPDGGRCHDGRRRSPDRHPRRREGGWLARLRLALMATTVGAAPPCAPGGDGGRTSRWKGRSGRRGGAGERKRWGSGRLTPGGDTGGGGMGEWRIRVRVKDRKFIYCRKDGLLAGRAPSCLTLGRHRAAPYRAVPRAGPTGRGGGPGTKRPSGRAGTRHY